MRQHGMTLIELVITITVGSIVVGFMAMFITLPMNAYSAQTRRATLVDSADSALRFMARDIGAALPNSVRTGTSGTITSLELLASEDGARYRDSGPLAARFPPPCRLHGSPYRGHPLSATWQSPILACPGRMPTRWPMSSRRQAR
jgi:prepilin-type N-terminal cleavage/methylation domain-containing protein